jgi:5-methylcytosine-specific restriction endonuclease McrA
MKEKKSGVRNQVSGRLKLRTKELGIPIEVSFYIKKEGFMTLSKMENSELLASAKKLAAQERKIQVEFLWHLLEIQRPQLFLEIGYPSLYDYVVTELGCSHSAAYRRIQAMRLLESVPNVAEKLEEGSINLTTAAQVQNFIKSEKKTGGVVSYRQKIEMVEAIENKSARDVEKHLISLKPENVIRPEKVRFVTPEIVEIRLMIPDSLKEKLDILRYRFSHINPEMTYLNLIEYLTDRALLRLEGKRKNTDIEEMTAKKLSESSSHSRYLSEKIRDAVWKRDNGCCTYQDPNSGKKCEGKYQLQIDHIFPWSQGGENKIENLRLLCGQHNRKKGGRNEGPTDSSRQVQKVNLGADHVT